ncbi:MAG: DUF3857 domain-containing protein [Chitinophagaceae bacterium]|nr:DUF3857 domain-containing protein [Chitinophagaceae bacterium]
MRSSTYFLPVSLIFLCTLGAKAQKTPTPNLILEEWSSKPAVHSLTESQKNESAVILLDKRRIEYIDVKEVVEAYRTLHKIIHVNDDRGIESFNRIYLPATDDGNIVDIKARTIFPDGKTIELDKKHIKELKEDNQIYKIFAMEGLVKGCEIEFYYTYKTTSNFFGKEVLQSRAPELDVQVELVAPERLIFETRSYNGLNTSTDTVLNNKRIVYLQHKDIPGVDEEKYSQYTSNLKRLDYKLSYNKSRSTEERLFTWNELARRAHTLNAVFTDKELKRAAGVVNDRDWKKLGSEREKVIAVEHYIKKNFASRDDISSDQADNVEWIIKNKICSKRGMARLFGAIFRQLDINYELVLCGARDEYTIDKDFENWGNWDNTLLYFPGLKKFIAPVLPETRFPWIDPQWAGTDGIYCKTTTIGNFTTAIASIKPVPLEDYKQSQSNIEVVAQLNEALDSLVIDAKELCTGYSARYYRAAFNFNSEEEQKQLIKEIIKNGTKTDHIISSKLENKDFESYADNKPVILNAVVKSGDLVERAGSKLLIKVGELIGPQAEMYQEKPRQLPLEIGYPHVLNRSIRLKIPQGYTVKNLKDLVMDRVHKEDGVATVGFTSTYTMNGDTIVIDVHEEYARTYYPISMYEDFKAIINTAADFNKVVLVLEKTR